MLRNLELEWKESYNFLSILCNIALRARKGINVGRNFPKGVTRNKTLSPLYESSCIKFCKKFYFNFCSIINYFHKYKRFSKTRTTNMKRPTIKKHRQ